MSLSSAADLCFSCVDFVEGEDPDQAYIDENLGAIEQHMMLGGARLAALMVDIYGTSAELIQ